MKKCVLSLRAALKGMVAALFCIPAYGQNSEHYKLVYSVVDAEIKVASRHYRKVGQKTYYLGAALNAFRQSLPARTAQCDAKYGNLNRLDKCAFLCNFNPVFAFDEGRLPLFVVYGEISDISGENIWLYRNRVGGVNGGGERDLILLQNYPRAGTMKRGDFVSGAFFSIGNKNGSACYDYGLHSSAQAQQEEKK